MLLGFGVSCLVLPTTEKLMDIVNNIPDKKKRLEAICDGINFFQVLERKSNCKDFIKTKPISEYDKCREEIRQTVLMYITDKYEKFTKDYPRDAQDWCKGDDGRDSKPCSSKD